MPFNMNAGYGRMIAESLASRRPYTGKIYFVTGSSDPNWEELTEMFPTGPEGNTRVWATLGGSSGLLASGLIADGGDDVVFVAPNYTETITAAAGMAVGTTSAGLAIIGLGEADERPLISFSTVATADFDIGSNGVLIENIRFDLTGIDALAAPIDVNDSGCIFRNCEFITADADGQCTVAILTDANASYFKLENCKFVGSDTAGTVSAVRIVGGNYHEIRDSYFDGAYKITAGAIQVTTTAAGYILIKDCEIINKTALSTAAMDFVSQSTATVVGCTFSVLSGSTPIHINELTTFGGTGRITPSRNYYRAATSPVAGTLL